MTLPDVVGTEDGLQIGEEFVPYEIPDSAWLEFIESEGSAVYQNYLIAAGLVQMKNPGVGFLPGIFLVKGDPSEENLKLVSKFVPTESSEFQEFIKWIKSLDPDLIIFMGHLNIHDDVLDSWNGWLDADQREHLCGMNHTVVTRNGTYERFVPLRAMAPPVHEPLEDHPLHMSFDPSDEEREFLETVRDEDYDKIIKELEGALR